MMPTKRRFILLGILGFVCGCSAESPTSDDSSSSYADRLRATSHDFAYYQFLTENLVETPISRHGVSIRVPDDFTEVPNSSDPLAVHTESWQAIGVALPGVLGMWKTQLVSFEGAKPQTGYLFLMSNHHLWEHSERSAMAFHQTLIEDVLVDLPQRKPLPIDVEWVQHNHHGHGLPYTSGKFSAVIPDAGPADFRLFLLQDGANQRRNTTKVAILFVVPQGHELPVSRPGAELERLVVESLQIARTKRTRS